MQGGWHSPWHMVMQRVHFSRLLLSVDVAHFLGFLLLASSFWFLLVHETDRY